MATAMAPVVDALRGRADRATVSWSEGGTGKEMAARAIHHWSKRATGPFLAVSCASLSEALLESELFGHEKGAFTGAVARRRGRIELAAGGTFFLDEVGELKPELQAKLLRVLQERSFERVGGNQTIDCDVRWIAATNRDLAAMMEEGRFREDLYHRLALFPIHLPPLRERRRDILPLARALLARIGQRLGHPAPELDGAAADLLVAGEWRGNVRELANALERALILSAGETVRAEHLTQAATPRAETARGSARTLADAERDTIEEALAAVGGNRGRAADRLGIGLRTLYDKLKRYRIE
jgi:two-component system response regulator FlrC